ncbi:MAG: heparinase II/III family protein, partial [Armatimonadetes bacterium]|nr:heparinase II/III family protein [Armatimonadota bacterium]
MDSRRCALVAVMMLTAAGVLAVAAGRAHALPVWTGLEGAPSATVAGAAWAQPLVRTGELKNVAADAEFTATSSASGKYAPEKARDGNASTWWASSDHAAVPQSVTVTFPEPRTFDTVVVIPANNPVLYSWIRRLKVEAAGQKATAELPARFEAVLLRLPKAVKTNKLTVTIESVHAPNHYVGLAEIMVFDDPKHQVKLMTDWRKEWLEADRTPLGRRKHPCVYTTAEDVARARRMVKKEDWARTYLAAQRRLADQWLQRSDDEIRALVPPKGACFAYGFTGCPICGASFGTWGGARCSFDDPGHVVCANGHRLPDAEHPDPGTGYRAPDGRIHYFVGAYNSWAVETLAFKGVAPLVEVYTLTGDERYAAKAAVILDALADIYPTCTKGSWDYPSHPPSGRLNRPWYQVARVLVRYVDWYDRLYDSPSLDAPSVRQGLTRRQNIERNLLMDGAEYCYKCSLDRGSMGLALHNGCADYIRGALAVGCCLNVPVYVRWALDGPLGIRSLLANNVDRDGRYFETSLSYADHTRNLYLTYARPLANWRSEEYPQGVDVYSWPHFARFYEAPDTAMGCAGHVPRFGDHGPDVHYAPPEVPLVAETDLRLMLSAAAAPATRYLLSLSRRLVGPRVEEWYLRQGGAHTLLLGTALPNDWNKLPALPDRLRGVGAHTAAFLQKGVVVLRANGPGDRQALLVRYGPSLNHGHFDDLGFSYYALGYDATYELGYGLGSTHTQVGWAKQTAAHNLVVIDERRQGEAPGSGGSLYCLADTPGLQLVEADSPLSYSAQKATVYCRTLALVGEPPDCYALDLFRVAGGKQHDYFFHALGEKMVPEGVEFGPKEGGSLAGPDTRWGDKIGNDGDIKGHPNKPYWLAPPGNGYGFLIDPQRAKPTGDWHATWTVGEG